MLTPDGPKVIEYNARFGDPETQVVLPRLKTDFVDIIDAVIDEKLDALEIEWSADACACVVMASGGYPQVVPEGHRDHRSGRKRAGRGRDRLPCGPKRAGTSS